jgi:hypothetical protein
MRWWALAAAAATAVIAGVLALGQPTPPAADPPPSDEPVRPTCPPPPTLPSPVGATASVVGLAPKPISLTLDGLALTHAPRKVPTGEHTLVALAPGFTGTRLRIRIDAFEPVLVDAAVDGQFVSLIVLGAACVSCPPPTGPLELSPGLPEPQAAEAFAESMARGDWKAGQHFFERLASGERTPRRLAALASLSGHRLDAEVAMPGLARQREALEATDAEARKAWLLERWNHLAETVATQARAFSDEAPGASKSTARRLDELSEAFQKAFLTGDVPTQAQLLTTTHALQTSYVKQLRALKPTDCKWQERVSAP